LVEKENEWSGEAAPLFHSHAMVLFFVPDLPIRIVLAADNQTLQFCHLSVAFSAKVG